MKSEQPISWRYLREQGAVARLQADDETVPAAELRAARAKIRGLQRLLGKKTEKVEILNDAIDIARRKQTDIAEQLATARGHKVKAVARALGDPFESRGAPAPQRSTPVDSTSARSSRQGRIRRV